MLPHHYKRAKTREMGQGLFGGGSDDMRGCCRHFIRLLHIGEKCRNIFYNNLSIFIPNITQIWVADDGYQGLAKWQANYVRWMESLRW